MHVENISQRVADTEAETAVARAALAEAETHWADSCGEGDSKKIATAEKRLAEARTRCAELEVDAVALRERWRAEDDDLRKLAAATVKQHESALAGFLALRDAIRSREGDLSIANRERAALRLPPLGNHTPIHLGALSLVYDRAATLPGRSRPAIENTIKELSL